MNRFFSCLFGAIVVTVILFVMACTYTHEVEREVLKPDGTRIRERETTECEIKKPVVIPTPGWIVPVPGLTVPGVPGVEPVRYFDPDSNTWKEGVRRGSNPHKVYPTECTAVATRPLPRRPQHFQVDGTLQIDRRQDTFSLILDHNPTPPFVINCEQWPSLTHTVVNRGEGIECISGVTTLNGLEDLAGALVYHGFRNIPGSPGLGELRWVSIQDASGRIVRSIPMFILEPGWFPEGDDLLFAVKATP